MEEVGFHLTINIPTVADCEKMDLITGDVKCIDNPIITDTQSIMTAPGHAIVWKGTQTQSHLIYG